MPNENPLSQFYRQPGVYLKLPSGGKFWDPEALTMPPNRELPVLPMNGKDDMSMRNADGLMNGATTVSVIESCLPSIKDAWKVPMIDIDAILIAIRLASYGNTMEFSTKCTKCGEQLDYEVDLADVLATVKIPDYDTPIMINDLMFAFRPVTYAQSNEDSQEKYIQQRTVAALQDSALSEEEKANRFRTAIKEITANTVAKLAEFVEYIITPDGAKVTDKAFIHEFIDNADQKTFNAIKDSVSNLNKQYTLEQTHIECDKCHHKDTRSFQFDPSNFFV